MRIRPLSLLGVVRALPMAAAFLGMSMAPVASQALADHMEIYGSFRVRSGLNGVGDFEINDKASRIGLRGELPMGDGLTAFARVEMGLNIIKSLGQLVFSGDPGFAYGEDQDAVTTRLGLLGVRTPFGAFSWGKQWSPYYDLGELTDRFNIFGGEAVGVYNLADGDPSGTGRASSALHYRVSYRVLSFAAQVQNRSTGGNDQNLADTYGGSVVLSPAEWMTLGVGFNEVRDGVEDPAPDTREVPEGDQAVVLGASVDRGRWWVGYTVAWLQEHEMDDEGRFFSGWGTEIFVAFGPAEAWRLLGGFNYLTPENEHPGQYRLAYGLAGVEYNFVNDSRVFLEFKLEGSRDSEGDRIRKSSSVSGCASTSEGTGVHPAAPRGLLSPLVPQRCNTALRRMCLTLSFNHQKLLTRHWQETRAD